MILSGREQELSVIDAVLGGPAPGLLLVEGAPGIGKSALLAVAVERALRFGTTVLSATADRLRADVAFGVVRQLFASATRDSPGAQGELLRTAPASLATSVLTRESAGPASGANQDVTFSSLHGLYWLIADLSDQGPLCLAIDDLQWTDASSLRWLDYLIRRIDGLPVTIIATARTGGPAPGAGGRRDIRSLFTTRLTVRGLSTDAVGEIGRAAFEEPGDPEFWAACRAATGGNPFLVRALLLDCRNRGIRPVAASAARIEEFGPPEVAHLLRDLFAGTGPEAEHLARVLTVLDEVTECEELAAVAGVDAGLAADLVHTLTSNGLLHRSGEQVGFTHAIIRAALAEALPPEERARLHGKAARLLRAKATGVERVAAHLLATDPPGPPWAGETLRAAAADATRRGAPESAARYLSRALLEPADAGALSEMLIGLGRAELSMDVALAISHLKAGTRECADPDERARAAMDLARAYCVGDDYTAAIEVLGETAEAIRPHAPGRALRLEVERVYLSLVPVQTSPGIQDYLSTLDIRQGAGTVAEHALAALLSIREAFAGTDRNAAVRYAQGALVHGVIPEGDESFVYNGPYFGLVLAGHLDQALRYCDAAVREAQRRGSSFSFAVACTMRAEVHYRLGQIPECEADARASLDARTQLGLHHKGTHTAVTVARTVDAMVERGALAEAGSLLDALDLGGDLPENFFYNWVLMSRARLRLARDEYAEAAADLLECGRRAQQGSVWTPHCFPWRSAAAMVLSRLGEADQAHALAEQELALARRWGDPIGIGLALHACGQVRGGAAGAELIRQSADLLATTPARLEQARALAALGTALRTADRQEEARKALREAVDLARQCGATWLADQAEAQLRAAGARPRTPEFSGVDSLTPSERRVALLAAGGMSNRDIAKDLFVTVRTVEVHLTNTYRKLRVQGRAALRAALPGTGCRAAGTVEDRANL